MKKIINKLGLHFWKFDHDTGFNKYYKCTCCHKRRVICPSGGYQPINRDWLGEDSVIIDWNKFNEKS